MCLEFLLGTIKNGGLTFLSLMSVINVTSKSLIVYIAMVSIVTNV